MKQLHKFRNGFLLLGVLIANYALAQVDSTKPEITVNLRHFVINNSFQYLLVETKIKVNKKWQLLKGQVLQLYLDSNKAENLITKVQTDSNGKAKAIIPPGLKSIWDASSTHKFIAVTEGSSREEETTTEFPISKARILMDTSNSDGARSVNVQVMKLVNNEWIPAKDVELKVGIRRMGGDLRIGDEETYTTDSLGKVNAEFKLDSIPGDEKGNLILVARIEDNDQFGNLSIEKPVTWGMPFKDLNSFSGRTLWGARGRAPVWLMLIAYSIMLAVWSVIIYLIYLVIRIKSLGKKLPG